MFDDLLRTPVPKTKLARYRTLSPNASVYVSPFGIGGMNFGEKWNNFMGSGMSKEDTFKLLDAYFEKGGNYIDTANGYQEGDSEKFIGEWAESRKVRDQVVIATRYSFWARGGGRLQNEINIAGNGSKSLRISVEQSLKSLRTDYIDILYVHWWDGVSSFKEIMDSLHNLVVSGKVLYLGISDTPAWMVARANQYARDHGKTPFVIYQGEWSLLTRDLEREVIPMCVSEGMAISPFGVVGAGKFMTDAEENTRRESGEKGRVALLKQTDWERTPRQREISAALEKVAAEVGKPGNLTAIAIAYIMQKVPYVFPVIGGRKISQLEGNIHALDVKLSREQIRYLESVSPLTRGVPHDTALRYHEDGTIAAITIDALGKVDRVRPEMAIVPEYD